MKGDSMIEDIIKVLNQIESIEERLSQKTENKDAIHFGLVRGKGVIAEGDKIYKIARRKLTMAENYVRESAKEADVEWFFHPRVKIYSSTICDIYEEEKVTLLTPPGDFDPPRRLDSLNYFPKTSGSPSEKWLRQQVFDSYGAAAYMRLVNFCKLYNLGNIYPRNCGRNKAGKIVCFDWDSGNLNGFHWEPF
jgi:hypothetical protein